MREIRLDRVRARPPLPDLPPRFHPRLAGVIRAVAPAYRRLAMKIRRFEVKNAAELIRLIQGFQDGRCRFAVAFRHPNEMDPQCVYYLFSNYIGRRARREGTVFREPPHVAFLYGRGVPLWAGPHVGWILPRVGALPVVQGFRDSVGLARIRSEFRDGRFPLALAPESQVTYHNHRVDRIARGAAMLGVWCHDDLRDAWRNEEVYILPVAPVYRVPGDPLARVRGVLEHTRGLTGWPETPRLDSRDEAYRILLDRSAFLADRLEQHYAATLGYTPLRSMSSEPQNEAALTTRFRSLAEYVLSYLEECYRIVPSGRGPDSLVSRIFPVRHAGWARVFRRDVDFTGDLPELERALADRSAADAYLLSRHLEIVDILAYFDPGYAAESPSMNRLVEVALNLHDVASRATGRTIAGRLSVPTEVTIRIGRPLPISAYRDLSSTEIDTGRDLSPTPPEGSAPGRGRDSAPDFGTDTGRAASGPAPDASARSPNRRGIRSAVESITGDLGDALEMLSRPEDAGP